MGRSLQEEPRTSNTKQGVLG
uniref:Uncharacterized protein n=1 Tax=Arundo donax TaxID=35708 RepID=A0A0A9B161_ARUDO